MDVNKSSYAHEDCFRRHQVLVTGSDAMQKKQSNKANDTRHSLSAESGVQPKRSDRWG